MGATPIKDWAEVVSQPKTIKPMQSKSILQMGTMPILKRKHPKRRPKELRQEMYAQLTLTSPRGVYTDRREERLSRRYHRGWKRIY